ncbi:hypothetical protein Van01_13400 [Micromonospora andamanensis]|uniref:Uncharacterized protein n=1 Tax=Micromonospora andamanensis TaxID=1287068 RepID=A0ABQ4HR52_9ACTN|nr:hypothetical protein Van01_13400 [Micromonospora andamanensis]
MRLGFVDDSRLPDPVERLDRLADSHRHRRPLRLAYRWLGAGDGDRCGTRERATGGQRAAGEQATPAHRPAGGSHGAGLGLADMEGMGSPCPGA